MNEKPAPRHVNRFVEELVECGVQLATILDHMYRNESPGSPPPPIVLRDLVAGTIASELARNKEDMQSATGLLQSTSQAIADNIFIVDPDSFSDLDDLDTFDDIPFGPEPPSEPERIH